MQVHLTLYTARTYIIRVRSSLLNMFISSAFAIGACTPIVIYNACYRYQDSYKFYTGFAYVILGVPQA